jgi:NTE family protein
MTAPVHRRKPAGKGHRAAASRPGAAAHFALVLAGGVALGAYEAGAYAALNARGLYPNWIAGSSTGAVNGAIIAGSAPEHQVENLRQFWARASAWSSAGLPHGAWRHTANWLSVARARFWGQPGVFSPLRPWFWTSRTGLYDNEPLRRTLTRSIDFDRLARAPTRLSILATDIETGEPVVFDKEAGDRLTVDHLMASCGFIPEFPAVEVGGRMLGDGALWANAPVDLVLRAPRPAGGLVCLVIDLFSRSRPDSIEAAAARRWDLIFANQTQVAIEANEREERLQRTIAELKSRTGRRGAASDTEASSQTPPPVHVLRIAYRAPPDEAGPERQFDFSRRSVAARWAAGERDIEDLIGRASILRDFRAEVRNGR